MNQRQFQLWLIDTGIILCSYLFVALLAVVDAGFEQISGMFTVIKFLLLYCCVLLCRMIMGTYRNIWRYANVTVYLQLVAADIAAGLIFMLAGIMEPYVSLGFAGSFAAVITIILGTLCSRFCYQFLYAYHNRKSDKKQSSESLTTEKHKINIAIVGAGNVGATLAQELLRNPRSYYNPYCFIDTDSNKIGKEINGFPVYSENDRIVSHIRSMPVQEIVIALPDADPEAKARLYNLYEKTGCKVKLYDYMVSHDGKAEGKRTLREFRIEDLLFRESLSINSSETKSYYAGKTILVTGGGGSIGSELCRQIAALHPKKLVILDIYENNAYEIQQELIRKYGDSLCMDTVIASVRDVERLEDVFSRVRPDIVFHAAAHKHVPLMENSACEAIKNNVIGTYNTANMAEKYGAEKFLLISTDKAVNPTNVMGASKRLCEMVIQCRGGSTCEFTAVRFGNVLGSNGSVIPLFKKQIQAGGPITLTDRRIIRYFMTIPEAVGLVMETGAMAHNGELFVLDMGKPVRILDLAENMIRLSGLRPYKDIDIVEVGLRPGEKLYEELLMKTEELDKTSNKMIFIERDKPLTREEVEQKLQILQAAVATNEREEIVDAIRRTVPTYKSPEEVNRKAEQAEEMSKAYAPSALAAV